MSRNYSKKKELKITKTEANTALAIFLLATAVMLIGGLAVIPTTMQSAAAQPNSKGAESACKDPNARLENGKCVTETYSCVNVNGSNEVLDGNLCKTGEFLSTPGFDPVTGEFGCSYLEETHDSTWTIIWRGDGMCFGEQFKPAQLITVESKPGNANR